jgi:competence protein ComEA
MRPSPFLLAFVFASTGLAIAIGAQGASPDASGVAPAPHTFPDAPGKDTVQMVCGACHSPDYITETDRDPKGWTEIWDMMTAYGAQASPAEWETIHTYILGQLATIDVNKATAEDLAKLFDTDAATAKAIADYRMANGNFKTIDDVKKVPGLMANKVDYRKNRLKF